MEGSNLLVYNKEYRFGEAENGVLFMKNKLPIGIQGFTGLRNDGYLYVGVTILAYESSTR